MSQYKLLVTFSSGEKWEYNLERENFDEAKKYIDNHIRNVVGRLDPYDVGMFFDETFKDSPFKDIKEEAKWWDEG